MAEPSANSRLIVSQCREKQALTIVHYQPPIVIRLLYPKLTDGAPVGCRGAVGEIVKMTLISRRVDLGFDYRFFRYGHAQD